MDGSEIRYYEFGDFRLDARRGKLTRRGEFVPVTKRQFALLLFLIENSGRILEHDEILETVWDGLFVEQSNLKKGISALRQILQESPDENGFIKTVPRRGYKFDAPVRALADGDGDTKEEIIVARQTNAEIIIEEEIEDDEISIATENLVPSAPAENFFTKVFRHKIAVAAAALLLLIGVFFFARYNRRGTLLAQMKLENLTLQKFTTSGNIGEAAISPDGTTIVYSTLEADSKQALWMRRVGVPNGLQLLPPADVEYDYVVISPDNNFVYYGILFNNSYAVNYKIPIFGGEPRKLNGVSNAAVAVAPDGKQIAYVRDIAGGGRGLYVADGEDGNEEREIYRVPDKHHLDNAKWSPDGKKFVFIYGESNERGRIWGIKEISADGSGEARELTTLQYGKIFDLSWLADGSGLIVCAASNDSVQRQLWRVAYPTGEMSRLTNDTNDYEMTNLSGDGKIILTQQSERLGDLWKADAANPQNAVRLTTSQNFSTRFAVLPDERILAETIRDGRRDLAVISADGSRLQSLVNQSEIRFPSLAPDGKTVLFSSRRTGKEEAWQADLDGGNLRRLTDDARTVEDPQISPDGKSLFYERDDNGYRLARVPLDGGTPFFFDERVGEFTFSPDGESLAYSFLDTKENRWKVAVRRLADNSLQKTFDIAPNTLLRWMPDGKNLLYNISEGFMIGGNLWIQPLDGSSPKQFLEVAPDKIFWTDWSPDKSNFYFTRGKTNSNLALFVRNE